jgi:hypothetical protein
MSWDPGANRDKGVRWRSAGEFDLLMNCWRCGHSYGDPGHGGRMVIW